MMMSKNNNKTERKNFRVSLFFAFLFSLMMSACAGGGAPDPKIPPPTQLTLDEFIKSKNFSGVVLVRKDSVDILRQAYGFADKAANRPNTLQTRFRIGSLTKAFTAVGIVQLKQDGLITNYSDPVKKYLPASPLNAQITIEQLLTHRSGIPDYLALDELDPARTYTPLQLAALFDTVPLDFTPGAKFEYSNSNYIMLGMLIETLSGQPYFDYMQSSVFDSLGLAATEEGESNISGSEYAKGYTSPPQDTEAGFIDMSIPYAAGSVSSNLSDMQSWASSFEDLSLISQQDYDAIFANAEYGFGWGTTPTQGLKTFWHTGGVSGFSSAIYLLPDDNGLIIILGNVEASDTQRATQEIAQQILKTEF